jgi:hypothetical protein
MTTLRHTLGMRRSNVTKPLVALALVAALAACGSSTRHSTATAPSTPPPPVRAIARGTAADGALKVYSTGELNVTGFRGSSTYSGDLRGETRYQGTSVYDPNTKTFKSEQIEVFTGTLRNVGRGTLTFDMLTDTAADASLEITGTVIRGTADLASTRGTIHFVGTLAASTYQFSYTTHA